MLTQERYEAILRMVNARGSVTVQELVEVLNSSESTIRRDLNAMHAKGMVNKVHGGATAVAGANDLREEYGVDYKQHLHAEEKEQIAQYAAGLVKPKDFVFLDAGTTTQAMLAYFTCKEAVYVTTGVEIARRLARRGFTVYVPAGRIRPVTEAIVGSAAILSLEQYHFTVGFFGTNGISIQSGFTTPDVEEADVKSTALKQCKRRIILADASKFGGVSAVTFASLHAAEIITDYLPEPQYRKYTEITEVKSI